MTTKEKPQKKFKIKVRHQKVAQEFRTYLEKNPKVSKKQKVKMFDTFCDSALLSEKLKEITRNPNAR
jgi:hypothetical protein